MNKKSNFTKTTLAAIFFIFTAFSGLKAQELWFDAGIKGAWGPTMIIDKNIMDEAHLNQNINTGFGYGAKFAINFGYIHGITFDFMLNNGHQTYDITENNNNGTVDIKWNTFDIYVLYRLYRTINYLEIGPKFSKVSSFKNDDKETSDFYQKSFPSAVLGFGWYVFGNKSFTGTLGVRVEYAFNDIVTPEGKDLGYPVNPYRTKGYDDPATTHILTAQLSFELNWGIGYFAKTACGGRRHFFSF